MNRRPRRLLAKRVETKAYFEPSVKRAGDNTAVGNYVNFLLGVVLVIVVYLIAGAFGL